MKLFTIENDNYHLDVHLSKIFIDEDGELNQKFGNYIVFLRENCYEFSTSKDLFDFILNELDSLIDPLPF